MSSTPILPLRRELAESLQKHCATMLSEMLPDANVFNMTRSDKGAAMLRKDWAAAGIDYQDDAGRVVDFHALRHTFYHEPCPEWRTPKPSAITGASQRYKLDDEPDTLIRHLKASKKHLRDFPIYQLSRAKKFKRLEPMTWIIPLSLTWTHHGSKGTFQGTM